MPGVFAESAVNGVATVRKEAMRLVVDRRALAGKLHGQGHLFIPVSLVKGHGAALKVACGELTATVLRGLPHTPQYGGKEIP